MAKKSIAFSFMPVGDFTLSLFVASDEPYSSNEWAQYMEGLVRAMRGPPLRTLVLTDGGSPNASQRKDMVDLFKGKDPPLTCIVSSHTVIRGLTTALSWFNPKITSLSPERMKEAFAYLEIPGVYEELIRKEIWRLRSELPLTKSIARVK